MIFHTPNCQPISRGIHLAAHDILSEMRLPSHDAREIFVNSQETCVGLSKSFVCNGLRRRIYSTPLAFGQAVHSAIGHEESLGAPIYATPTAGR